MIHTDGKQTVANYNGINPKTQEVLDQLEFKEQVAWNSLQTYLEGWNLHQSDWDELNGLIEHWGEAKARYVTAYALEKALARFRVTQGGRND